LGYCPLPRLAENERNYGTVVMPLVSAPLSKVSSATAWTGKPTGIYSQLRSAIDIFLISNAQGTITSVSSLKVAPMNSVHEELILELRALEATNPQQAIDRIDSVMEMLSIEELGEILGSLYEDETVALGIDWRFTTMQWKVGNQGCEDFLETYPEARLKVWSLPFLERCGTNSQTRYTTCLPFQFRAEWEARRLKATCR
jgi:hypothetical protein